MGRFGLCGPTYTSQSVNADCQRCVNLYPETNESGQGNAAQILLSSPGLGIFCMLPEGPLRGEFEFNGRGFAVGGTRFCEVLAGGHVLNIGNVGNDGLPATMVANQADQLLISSAGTIYLYDLAANILSQPAAAPANISIVEFSDGFFLALSKNSNQFQLSNSLDGNTWSGINVAKVSVFPENLVTMIVDHREVALLGSKRSAVYFDSGGTFPYDVVPGGFIEQGAAAIYGRSRLDNSVFWLGKDENGQGIAWRNNGYTPQRISNHSVEFLWSRYPRIDDAISYAFQDQGHTFWHIYFPSGLNDSGLPLGASWRYDAATQMWHEVSAWDAEAGRYTAHRSMCHMFHLGMHLVGDWGSANIYQMSSPTEKAGGGWNFCDDAGTLIRRMRRSPHVGTLGKRTFHNALQLFVEAGVGPQPPLLGPNLGPPRAPSQLFLEDANGAIWQVTIDDNGNFVRILATDAPGFLGFGADGFGVSFGGISGGAVTPSQVPLILEDSGMVPSTAWQIGITIAGNLTATPVPFSSSYPQIFQMASTQGNHLTGILVTKDGLIQANVPDQSRAPQVCMRYSKDWGHTWSNEHWKGIGKAGEFLKRVIWRRLGWSWDRVYEISMTDPVPWRIIDADLDATGFQPTERLVHQLRKGA